MIAIIHVSLTRGEITSPAHLQSIAASIYPKPQTQITSILSSSGHLSSIYSASVHVCSPRPGSIASFFFTDAREFEVIIETLYHGHLFRSAEGTVKMLQRKLQQSDMKAEFRVSLQAISDAQDYIIGIPCTVFESVWSNLRDNLIALSIGVVLVVVAQIWLTQYIQEAIAGVISLVLFSTWQTLKVWNKARRDPLGWRIND